MEPAGIVAIYTAEAAGCPMCAHERVEVVAGTGIRGDRYATRKGHWSDPRWRDQQLTLVEAEVLEAIGLPWEGSRRNLVTRGVALMDLAGLDFALGGARLRAKRQCAPCRYIEMLNHRPGLMKELGEGRGGLRVAVVEGGTMCVGDEIRDPRLAPEEPEGA